MIHFIRHGESLANAGGTTSDVALIPLTELGHTQAQSFAAKVHQKPDLIIHSPYKRAKDTASYLALKYPTVDLIERPVQEFTYLSPDACLNTTHLDRVPLFEAYWNRCDPFYKDHPSVESFADFALRLTTELDFLKNYKEKLVYVFCHERYMAAVKMFLNGEFSKYVTPAMMKSFSSYCRFKNCGALTMDEVNHHWVQVPNT